MWQAIEADKRKSDAISKFRHKCKLCGHVVIISKQDKALCDYCGKWIFKDNKTEFIYRMNERLKQV